MCTTPPASRSPPLTGRQYIRALAPVGRSITTGTGCAAGQHVGGLREQHDLVGGVEDLARLLVHHHDFFVQRQHDSRAAPAGAQVLLQQLELAGVAVGEQRLRDLVGGGLGQGDQQPVGVPAPAGQIDRAERHAGDRVPDRDARAGQVLQVLGVVLMAEHVHRPAALEGGPDPVGPDRFLGVAETGGELDAVQVPVQLAARGQPGQHHAGGVGEDHADRLAFQVLAQASQHRHGAAGQRGVEVRVAGVGQVDAVRGDVPPPGPPPGRQDRVAHLASARRCRRSGTAAAHPPAPCRRSRPVGSMLPATWRLLASRDRSPRAGSPRSGVRGRVVTR